MSSARPIRLCMLTHSIYQRDSRVRRYAEYLVEEDMLVDVICLASDRDEPPCERKNIRIYAIPLTRSRREGFLHAMEWLYSVFLMGLYLTWLDIRYRYDLVHVHNMPDFIVFCALVPRLRGCPVLLNLHDPSPEVARSKLGLSPNHPLARVQVFIEKISVAFSSHVVTATDSFKALLVQRGVPPDKISVVRNAADERIFKPLDKQAEISSKKEGFTLLYVGTVAPRYGLDICIRALPLLRSEIPNLRLRIVPKIVREGVGLEQALNLARTLGVEDMIRVDEPAPLDQMPAIMREADLGVYPALRDCHMDLAMSLKIPEMANVGLCIVGTRLSVLEEYFGDDAIAFAPSGDYEALARKISELYHQPELRQSLARRAAERSQRFNWRSQYEIYRQLLQRLLNS
ncbi:MAG: glycosyltransferase family 4 protein [Deltaproteobacteria bacterium]|nr:glycosyltransferase family 4 protein [Deltaproteobacteria bacterium]